jgi:hypothetical protein
MKRNLTAVAAIALAVLSNAAMADNNFTFDDAYWKRAESTSYIQPAASTETRSKYSHVDDFNP